MTRDERKNNLPYSRVQVATIIATVNAAHLAGAVRIVQQHSASFGRLQQAQLADILSLHCVGSNEKQV